MDIGFGPVCTVCLESLPTRLAAAPLELATTEELVNELIRRETFRGVIAWQQGSFKGPLLTDWQWRYKSCDPAGVFTELAENIKGNA